MYLFPELKHLLRMWRPMLQGVVNDGMLPVDAVLGAEAAAASAFDTQGECLRFKVPSSGFLLIWSTCPHSPAHSLLTPDSSTRVLSPTSHQHPSTHLPISATLRGRSNSSIVGLKRGTSEMLTGRPVQQPLPMRAASDNILVELGRAPQCTLSVPTLKGSGDSGSNGSDSTYLAGSGTGSDSGGSGGGSGASGGPFGSPKQDSVFAVPPPRPARHGASTEVPDGLSVVPQACSQGPVCTPSGASVLSAALARVSVAAPVCTPKTAFEAFSALATAANIS